MPEELETERNIRLILSRDIIFPEDQLKIRNLIKDKSLVKGNDGTISLRVIEERNLIFPEDVATLRKIVRDINSGNNSFKSLMELLIAGAGSKGDAPTQQSNINYFQDPITYNETQEFIDNNGDKYEVQMKKSDKSMIIPIDNFITMDGTELFQNLYTLSTFKSKHSDEYGVRIYISDDLFEKRGEVGDNAELNKMDKKIRKPASEYLQQWNDVFEDRSIGDLYYDLLNTLKDKKHIEIYKIVPKNKFNISESKMTNVISEHIQKDKRVIELKDNDQGVISNFFGFISNMVGGGSEITPHQYINMKHHYKYKRDAILNELLN